MHTTFLATISPSLSDADETASTLKCVTPPAFTASRIFILVDVVF